MTKNLMKKRREDDKQADEEEVEDKEADSDRILDDGDVIENYVIEKHKNVKNVLVSPNSDKKTTSRRRKGYMDTIVSKEHMSVLMIVFIYPHIFGH